MARLAQVNPRSVAEDTAQQIALRYAPHLPAAKAHSPRQVGSVQSTTGAHSPNDQTTATLTHVSRELLPFPANPNGSVANTAGLCDPTGRVMGLMPHPDRHLHRWNGPRWTREGLPEEGDGVRFFRNDVEAARLVARSEPSMRRL